MKKYELIVSVSKETGVKQKDVEAVIDAMSTSIVNAVIENQDSVNLPALGMFKLKINPARKGRNPLTGEAIDIKESHTIKFQPTASVKKVFEPAKKAPAKKK